MSHFRSEEVPGTRMLMLLAFAIAGVATALASDLPSYMGSMSSDESQHDGRLRWVVGAQSHALFRPSRTFPQDIDGKGDTYNHQPMMAYWGGSFWVSYQGGPSEGSGAQKAPVPTYLCSSPDGRAWSRPQVVIPSVLVNGQWVYTHERMGFHIGSNGHFLVLGFMGKHPVPNDGTGYARVVREVYGPGNYGPLYAIRYNRGYSAANTPWPLFSTSNDPDFVAACNEILNDKLERQQWYEEDRDPSFFVVNQAGNFSAKAFDYYTLPDARIVGFWKGSYMTAAPAWDWGQVPAPVSNPSRFGENQNSKMWGQKMADGNFGMAYSLNYNGARFPLVLTTSSDGLNFTQDWLAIHNDFPETMYTNPFNNGLEDNKDGGPQYVRGMESRSAPPGNSMWVAYSVNKEVIWVTEIPLPVQGTVTGNVSDNFENMTPGGAVTGWNIYSAGWCPVDVVSEGGNNFLRLQDKDPYDYAKADRIFQESGSAQLSLNIVPHQANTGRLEVELANKTGLRPVRIVLDNTGRIMANNGTAMVQAGSYTAGVPISLGLAVNATAGTYSLTVNGIAKLTNANVAEAVTSVERLEIRTGEFRMNDLSRLGEYPNYPIGDLPNADNPVVNAVFDVDNVAITTQAGGGTPIPPIVAGTGSSALITKIVSVSTGQSYRVGVANLGALPYIDRTYTLGTLPPALVNQEMIQTSNNDDYVVTPAHLTFTLSASADVYVAYSALATNLPGWANGFTLTPGTITAGGAGTFNIYKKTFPAGNVTLGGNDRAATGANSNYFVIALKAQAAAPPPIASQPAGALITQIVSVSTGSSYRIGVADVGALPYIDRTYTLGTLPPELANQEMIQTSNNDDYVVTPSHLTFTLSASADVYLAYSALASKLPGWASGFILTPGTITAGGAGTFNLYKNTFPAGNVTLGGNDRAATGASSNYFVIALQAQPAVAAPAIIKKAQIAPAAPVITSQPSNATAAGGRPAVFSAVASGTAPLTYQWSKNGSNIKGATSSSYTTSLTSSADNSAIFRVTVANASGSVTSRNAVLLVRRMIQIMRTSPPAKRKS